MPDATPTIKAMNKFPRPGEARSFAVSFNSLLDLLASFSCRFSILTVLE